MPLWLRILVAIFGPRWQERKDENDNFPDYEGWYRVMVSGDSEQIDGHTIYEFGDYETWAYFTLHEDGGNFVGVHDEDNYSIFAWCGPMHFAPYREGRS